MAGVTAFQVAYMSAGAMNDDEKFVSFASRQMRYQVYWSLYENDAYSKVHTWSTKLKSDYGLYKYIRNIYNPAARLGDFWQTHLMGGALDPEAGDGKDVPTALPVLTDSDALRKAIAELWKQSNWLTNKEIFTLFGAIMGDAVLRVVDNPERKRVCLEVVSPLIVKDLTTDDFGNVKGYIIEEQRPDPRPGKTGNASVTYTEIAQRDNGDAIMFETLLNNSPYAWNGKAESWSEGYGFVPMVVVQHRNVGKSWGWSELHSGFSKIREADDQASLLNDQIRKMVNAPWLFSGVGKPQTTPAVQNSDATTNKNEPGRDEAPALYAPAGSTATPLVAPLNINEVTLNIKELLAELERDYPELQMDIWNAKGDTSGKALRIARQRTEAKVEQRRANYDDGTKRAIQMAVAIGGWRGYEGYKGFNLDSYKAGNLDFGIGKRSVFAVDPLDTIEKSKAMWDTAKSAREAAGVAGMKVFLESQGLDEKQIAAIETELNTQSFGQYP